MGRTWRCAAAASALVALTAFFYRPLLFDGLILGDYDAFAYFYPLRYYAAESLTEGRFPLWNPYLFLGAPFFANVQTALLYPPNALFLWLSTPYAYSASIVAHVFLAGGSMYLLSRRSFGVSILPALIAGMSFMFSGFISGQVGHINQLNVSAWLPLLLLAFDEALRRRSPALALGAGLVAAIQFLAGHTQEWYFSTVVLGLFALWRVAVPAPDSATPPRKREGTKGTHHSSLITHHAVRRLRPVAYLALVGVVEAGIAAVQLLPAMELSQQSIRGGGMAYGEVVSFSLPPSTALYTLLPTYPAELFSEYVGYVGVIPLLLAVLALLGWAVRPAAAFMALLAGLGLFLALGGYNPAYAYLFEWVPGIDLFRVPARWLLVYTFGLSGLAGLGAQLVHDLGGPRRQAGVRRTLGGVIGGASRALVGSAMIAVGAATLALFFLVADPKPGYGEIALWGGLVALALALVALASLGRRVGYVSLGLLGLMVAGELWLAGGKMVSRHPIPYEAFKPQRSSTSFILGDAAKRETPGRLLSFATDKYEVKETPDYNKQYGWLGEDALFEFLVAVKLSEALAANLPAEYGLEAVDGYDGGILPLRRYAELKTLLLPVAGIPADNPLRTNLPYVPPIRLLDLLNVRYVLGTKMQDTQVDNVYYDRGISVVLEPGDSTYLGRMPELMTTSVGVISSTEGARDKEDGVLAAGLTVTDTAGAIYQMPLRLGMETGETPERDSHNPRPAHRKPRGVPAFDPGETDADYYSKIHLPDRIRVKEIRVKNLLPDAKVRLRAITLIDDVAAVSSPLVLSDRLDRELFFDMKVYISREPLPRAFMVHSSVVRDGESALETLRQPRFPLDETVVLAPSPTAMTLYRPTTGQVERSEVRMRSYRPEEVILEVTARQDGYLVLLDPYYPGWTAEVDGVEVPIEAANYLFRGVYLDRGEHTVAFSYAPASFRVGLRITLVSLVLISGALLLLAVRYWWRRRMV